MWCVSHRLLLNNFSLRMSSNPSLKFKPSSTFPLNCAKLFSRQSRMETGEGAKSAKNPKDDRIEELIQRDPKGGWDICWEQGLTPWDLKQPTPVLLHLHQTDAIPKGRTLVPGCGTGYDVIAIASPDRYVVGLEISEHAVKKANEEDFFTWQPTDLFDLIYDYTFFCAIEPSMRSAWAQRIQDYLKPDGELITLMFPISDHVGGPPFKVSVTDYEEVLHPMGFRAVSIMDNDHAVGPRKGREKLGRWKRSPNLSLL